MFEMSAHIWGRNSTILVAGVAAKVQYPQYILFTMAKGDELTALNAPVNRELFCFVENSERIHRTQAHKLSRALALSIGASRGQTPAKSTRPISTAKRRSEIAYFRTFRDGLVSKSTRHTKDLSFSLYTMCVFLPVYSQYKGTKNASFDRVFPTVR